MCIPQLVTDFSRPFFSSNIWMDFVCFSVMFVVLSKTKYFLPSVFRWYNKRLTRLRRREIHTVGFVSGNWKMNRKIGCHESRERLFLALNRLYFLLDSRVGSTNKMKCRNSREYNELIDQFINNCSTKIVKDSTITISLALVYENQTNCLAINKCKMSKE